LLAHRHDAFNGNYQITRAIDDLSPPRKHRGQTVLAAVERDAEAGIDVTCVSRAEGAGQTMEKSGL
jgi:hypothetical protein